MSFKNDEAIVLRGARVHNLKNISLSIPRDKLTVLTGPSGSGKSSLAFDTIYAEGQRRYVESLSAYARQFLEQVSKPDVDSIDGLSPTISIEQRTTSYNPRSTVGTVTEIHDHFRLLFARIGQPHCWKCGKPIRSQTQQQIVDRILENPVGSRISILAPIIRDRKGEYQKELLELRQKGFVRAKIDGEVRDLSETITLDRHKRHHISVYVDRLIVKTDDQGAFAARVSESVELALRLADGVLVLETAGGEVLYSEKFACVDCGVSYPNPEPKTFSFNSPAGACPKCEGLGIEPTDAALADESDASDADTTSQQTDAPRILRGARPCSDCGGSRLRKESLQYRIAGLNIHELSSLSVAAGIEFFRTVGIAGKQRIIADRILKEIENRLSFLNQVGVGYLSLTRSARSLSGGEAQRIRLATQIGSALVGVIYVLDEPSIGLHQRDNHLLIQSLENLRDQGNTVIVVEHDRDTMEHADWIVDIGPGAGVHGGEVVAQGSYRAIVSDKNSVTGAYLSGRSEIPVPAVRRAPAKDKFLTIENARANNLKNVTARLPLGCLVCITGVSGSGKSTLVLDLLYRGLAREIYGSDVGDLAFSKITGADLLDKVIEINQKPIGKTPRSNPATYTSTFGPIRELFALVPEARARGYGPGRFSFNVKGGRCDACEGDGTRRIEMHFLPDVFVTCDVCLGRRYNTETLDIRYKGKNIQDVLEMTVEEGAAFFDAVPALRQKFETLNDVGLGYIRLGQPATTLSGGEAQRIKLAKELSRRSTGKTLYILDEPSTGLHFDDIKKLLQILDRLVTAGNSVIVIEHNLDIIKVADYILDLGPEGGAAGGKIVAEGTPEAVAASPGSQTGAFLKPYLFGNKSSSSVKMPGGGSSSSPDDRAGPGVNT